jgi:hypothetical protein
MILQDWLTSISASDLHSYFVGLTPRKLHLLTAVFLRRVWDELPSHTQLAVAATEKFVEGRISRRELARIRSTDLLESCEGLWLGEDENGHDEQLIGMGCLDCPWCDQAAVEYECRSAKSGNGLDGVRAAIDHPTQTAVRAALHVREVVAWRAAPEERPEAERTEITRQFELFREIVGYTWGRSQWSQWRTLNVLALARGIHRDQAFDRLPILADALQDAGCDDEIVLKHCREGTGHVRGCWVVDLATGIG